MFLKKKLKTCSSMYLDPSVFGRWKCSCWELAGGFAIHFLMLRMFIYHSDLTPIFAD